MQSAFSTPFPAARMANATIATARAECATSQALCITATNSPKESPLSLSPKNWDIEFSVKGNLANKNDLFLQVVFLFADKYNCHLDTYCM